MIIKYYYMNQETFERGEFETNIDYINGLFNIAFEEIVFDRGCEILSSFHYNKFNQHVLIEDYDII